MDEHGKWGAANKQGKVEIPFEYDHLMTFTEGVAPFKHAGKHGFINEKNEAIIPAQYDYASTFNNGIALVQNREQFYLIDKKGQRIPGTLDIAEEHYFRADNDGNKLQVHPLNISSRKKTQNMALNKSMKNNQKI